MNFEQNVREMKALGEHLVDYSYPLRDAETENDISCLRSRYCICDGYPVQIYYSKSRRGDGFLETVQVMAQFQTFLPFNLPVKIARKFLGDRHLGYIDLVQDGKKVYCLALCSDAEGKTVPPEQNILREETVDGVSLSFLDPNEINFF